MIVAITQDEKDGTLAVDYLDPATSREDYEKANAEKEFPEKVLGFVRVSLGLGKTSAVDAFNKVCIDGHEELREVLDSIVISVFKVRQS